MPASQAPPLERKFNVNGLTIAGQQWGSGNKHRVIALHGWLDNSASFETIAPHIEDCDIIALDFAGNGESDHRSQHGSYNIWDDLPDILAIADALEWQSFNLLAHSRGAFVALLLSASVPDRVEKLLMLDGAVSLSIDEEDSPKNLSRYLRDQCSLYKKPSRVMASIDEVIQRRTIKIDISAEECLSLARRSIKPAQGQGYVWRHDPRATGTSAFKLSSDYQKAFLSALTTPSLMILAKNGFSKWDEMRAVVKEYSDIEVIIHDGGHHMHMELKHCESLAKKISSFFAKH